MRNVKIFLLLFASVTAGTCGAEVASRLAGDPRLESQLDPDPVRDPGAGWVGPAEEAPPPETGRTQDRASDS